MRYEPTGLIPLVRMLDPVAPGFGVEYEGHLGHPVPVPVAQVLDEDLSDNEYMDSASDVTVLWPQESHPLTTDDRDRLVRLSIRHCGALPMHAFEGLAHVPYL